MNLRTQRRIAAELLGAGENRVWINPEKLSEVGGAITKDDVRKFISQGIIRAKPKTGVSNVRAKVRREQKKSGRQRGAGKRRGAKHARTPQKGLWIKRVRAIRRELARLREERKIMPKEHSQLYRMAGAGTFKDKADLHLQISKMKEAAQIKGDGRKAPGTKSEGQASGDIKR